MNPELKAHFPALIYKDAEGSHTVELAAQTVTLGRSPNVDVVLSDAYVSRRHACIVSHGTSFEVQDLGSTHGTFVNGNRVQCAALSTGDVIQLGSRQAPRLRFDHRGEDELAESSYPGSMPDLLSSLSGLRGSSNLGAITPTQGMEQLNFLLSAARQLNAGGALTDILRALLELTLQLTGVERGFAFLQDPAKPSGLCLALGLDAQGNTLEEDATISRSAIQGAVQSEKKFSVSDTLSHDGASGWQSVVANQIRCIYCIPLRKHGSHEDPNRLLGLLYLDSHFASFGMNEVDHQLLDTIAGEAAGLVHNVLLAEADIKARKAREELEIASRIHQGLMSFELPVLPYAKLAARSVPCLCIGGDFFDAVALDDWVTLTIADVSGKGVSAAIVGATLQGIIHAQLLGRQELPAIATVLNRFLCSRSVGKYVTYVMVKLFTDGRAEYINCGHVQPLLVSREGMRLLEEGNTVAGLIPSAQYTSARLLLEPGDRILLTTDGITEAENLQGEQFGAGGLERLAAAESLEHLLEALAQFQGPLEAQDDCTTAEIRYTGTSTQALA